MSTDHGDDGGGNSPAPWWANPVADIVVLLDSIVAVIIVLIFDMEVRKVSLHLVERPKSQIERAR